jgi:hypothetical protein
MNSHIDNRLSQFIVCKSKAYLPENWPRHGKEIWWLACHPMLPIVEMRSPDSTCIGWLIGYPINTATERMFEQTVTVSDIDAKQLDLCRFESWLDSLGGRFACLLLVADVARLYLDSYGSLAAVYAPKREIVASSTILIPHSQGAEEYTELNKELDIPNSPYWYPFGCTPIKGVERLLPNHFLDLNEWKSVRHWPMNDIGIESSTENSVEEISSILRNNISAVLRDYPAYITLTAGRDSRMLLACARDKLERVKFLTLQLPTSIGKTDRKIATKLAQDFQLDHRLLEYQLATKSEQDIFLGLTGHCIGGAVAKVFIMLHQSDPNRPILTGLGGCSDERGLYWRRQDTPLTPLYAASLLDRLRLPRVPELEERAERWLRGLSHCNTMTILSLLYVEQRVGCWGTPTQYGNYWNIFELIPFSHRRIHELTLSLPHDYRRKKMLSTDLIRNQWPQLLSLPFNRDEGVLGYIKLFGQKLKYVNTRMTSIANRSVRRGKARSLRR